MQKAVPTVDAAFLIEAHQKVLSDRELFGSTEVMISVVSLFSKKLKSHDILHITHRLMALANFIDGGHADRWILKESATGYLLVNEGLLRAAARAPLREAEYIKDMHFEKTSFLMITLEESDAEGSA